MFDPKYDDARRIIAHTMSQIDAVAELMNAVNPQAGGPGLDSPAATHEVVAILATEVHNLAFAIGDLIDALDGQR